MSFRLIIGRTGDGDDIAVDKSKRLLHFGPQTMSFELWHDINDILIGLEQHQHLSALIETQIDNQS